MELTNLDMHFKRIGSGRTILFLHGWGCDGGIFLPVAKLLDGYKCILLDFNGFGQSLPPPIEGWGVEQYSDALVRFFKLHNLHSVSIVAHSFGCRVAMVFASLHPECVDKMMLVAPAGLRFFSLRRWLKVRKYKLDKFLYRHGLSVRKPSSMGSEDFKSCTGAMKNTFVKVVNKDLSRYARKVKCETLIVNGREDTETTLKHARRLRRLISHSALTEIDGSHFAMFSNPASFAKSVVYFMESEK